MNRTHVDTQDHAAVLRDMWYSKTTGRLLMIIEGELIDKSYPSNGYRAVRYRNQTYLVHRLAYFWVEGVWPVELDHRNHVRHDNRWSNLRHGTHKYNLENLTAPSKVNKVGFLGVHRYRDGRYSAQIKHHGKTIWLGYRDTPELAHRLYVEAKRKLHAGNTL